MLERLWILLFIFLLQGCATWDSRNFDAKESEIAAAKQIHLAQKSDTVDNSCRKVGELRLLSLSQGQPVNVVAIRKFKKANLVKHTSSRMHGGVFGEGPTDFFDVFNCEQ